MRLITIKELKLLIPDIEVINNPEIGKQINLKNNVRRIVVYLEDKTYYSQELAANILMQGTDWILIPVRGMISDLKQLVKDKADGEAMQFQDKEREVLAKYLSSRSMMPGSFDADLYVLSSTGDILITWNHHSRHEGITLDISQIDKTTKVLCALNEIGVEMEICPIRPEHI